MRHSNTYFGAYLYSAGTQHENLLKSIDYEQYDLFYFAGQRGNSLQPRLTQLKSMERIWKKKKKVEWTGEAEIRTRKKL